MSGNQTAGAGLLPAPATMPDELTDLEVARELVDLLCDDDGWLEETFQEIVQAGWADQPPGGEAPLAARPRRHGLSRRRARRLDRGARSQWFERPHRRQRSPPALA